MCLLRENLCPKSQGSHDDLCGIVEIMNRSIPGDLNLGQSWLTYPKSIFSVMTEQANKAGAVNLAQGFPDFDGPQEIKDRAYAAMNTSFVQNQYAPSVGILPLRQALSRHMEKKRQLVFDPLTEVTIFTGATEALFCAIAALCQKGDEVLAFAPFFDSYPAAAMAVGARVRAVNLVPGPHGRWVFNEAELAKAISSKTKVLLINTPHNPTGKVFTQDELVFLAKLAIKHNLIVVTDEVYEELTFGEANHVCMAGLPGMRDRTITISSTSKTFSMTGWKVGYAFASPELSQILRSLHQFTVFCTATPLQYGMLAAFELPDSYYDNFRSEYDMRRRFLSKALTASGFKVHEPEGSYFIVADYRAIRDITDMEFANWLTREKKIAAIPIAGFYEDPSESSKSLRLLRFAFCKRIETLTAAEKALQQL